MNQTISAVSVKTIKLVLVHEHDGGIQHTSRIFRTAKAAVRSYADFRLEERQYKKYDVKKLGAAYHRMTQKEFEYESKLQFRFERFILPKFEELLK